MTFEKFYQKIYMKYPSVNKETFRINSKGFKALLKQSYEMGMKSTQEEDMYEEDDDYSPYINDSMTLTDLKRIMGIK